MSQGCTSGRAAMLLQELVSYVRYLWPAARYGSLPPNLERACTSMHQSVVARIARDEKEMNEHCEAERVGALQSSLEQSRHFAWAIVGGFAVYAEDGQNRSTDGQAAAKKRSSI